MFFLILSCLNDVHKNVDIKENIEDRGVEFLDVAVEYYLDIWLKIARKCIKMPESKSSRA